MDSDEDIEMMKPTPLATPAPHEPGVSKLEQIREAFVNESTSDTNILPDTDEGPPEPEPGEMQPLPSFDNVVVPETQPYKCAECGQEHQGPLVSMIPLGDMKVQLQYRALDKCPNTELQVVDGGPVIGEANDA